MNNLFFFGKPFAFEVIDYTEGELVSVTDKAGLEPKLKTKARFGEVVRHSYSEGYWYLQVYSGAFVNNNVRSGVDIGVGFKSTEPIELCEETITWLSLLLKRFEKQVLDNRSFKDSSLKDACVDFLKQEDKFEIIIPKVLAQSKPVREDTSIVFLKNFTDDIKHLSELNLAKDIYLISAEEEILNIDENKLYLTINKPQKLKLDNNQKVVSIENLKDEGSSTGDVWGDIPLPTNVERRLKEKVNGLERDLYGIKGKLKKRTTIFVLIIAFLLLTICLLVYKLCVLKST